MGRVEKQYRLQIRRECLEGGGEKGGGGRGGGVNGFENLRGVDLLA